MADSRDRRLPSIGAEEMYSTCLQDAAQESKLYLQDLDLVAQADESMVGPWGDARCVCGQDPANYYLKTRFAIVDDETMSFLWDTATQLDQRVRINERTGTVDKGACRDNVFVEQLWRRLRQELRA